MTGQWVKRDGLWAWRSARRRQASAAGRMRLAADVLAQDVKFGKAVGWNVRMKEDVGLLLRAASSNHAGWWAPEGGSRCCPVDKPCDLHDLALSLANLVLGGHR